MPVRFLSLFSGIEAASAAWHSCGWQCVGVAEIEKFPCAVLKHHYPEVPNLGNVMAADFMERVTALGPVDVLIGIDSAWTGSYVPKRKETRAMLLRDNIENHASAARWNGPIMRNMELFG